MPVANPSAAARQRLAPDHLAKCQDSGLSDATITANGLYTEHSPGTVAQLLGWPAFTAAPALVFPHRNLDGAPMGYAIVRPSNPRFDENGEPVKYEVPMGRGAKAYFAVGALRAINTPRQPLLITEGILKALASTQAGIPCVGLMGVWNWTIKREDKTGPRQLIDDLAAIDWQDRPVLIVFDFDDERKPNVRHAEAELARVLTLLGARVRIAAIPRADVEDVPLRSCSDPISERIDRLLRESRRFAPRQPIKQGLDEYVKRNGELAYCDWVRHLLADPQPRTLHDWRNAIIATRQEIVRRHGHGIYLDRSQTGTGKSTADETALSELDQGGGRSLSLQPTHINCQQVEDTLTKKRYDAAAFPPLTDCQRDEEAREVIAQGFPIAVLCKDCPFRDGCLYRIKLARAFEAKHAIATHKRAEIMTTLAEARDYITLHEDPLALLRPTYTVREGDGSTALLNVAKIAGFAAKSANAEDKRYYEQLAANARELRGWLDGENETQAVPLPIWLSHAPYIVDDELWNARQELGIPTQRDAYKLCRAATDGELEMVAVKVDEKFTVGGSVKLTRSLLGVGKTAFPAAVVINDATANRGMIETATGQPVKDITPRGKLNNRHPSLQIPVDVTLGIRPERAAEILREVLNRIPYQRVGVITHLCLKDKLRALLGDEESRIVRIEHFRGGQSRGSNEWLKECEAIIVFGTPRVPPAAIRERLIQLGDLRAAKLTASAAGWGPDYWSGVTQSGKRVTVRSRCYSDHSWHAAYRSIVWAELIQSVGRGRGLLPEGKPVYVATVENLCPPDENDGRLGLTLLDGWKPGKASPMTEAEAKVFDFIQQTYSENRKPVKTSEVAARFKVTRQVAHEHVSALEKAGMVRRIGERGGWEPM